ncbi:HigA family addiction module antitoxin [Microbulbifer rhizosphaerae]|uniref:Addiction module HigA family antidote n=1 Tax=Microbulbifer rhizosphaerae TaxID=1562603 RepID=A0A7W4Z710_9GAMM|nr:HigA family addiction module antitoxin [Microbulbifer rhizosphaerae]MBB3059278.1 addiction module HigA family antidote [Microbulbifer rhizosphaerae]
MVRMPTHRQPIHPGEILVEEFLRLMNITQLELADAIHITYQRVNKLVNQKRGITPSTALRLARFFGVSTDFWLNLQIRWDLYNTTGRTERLGRYSRYHPLAKDGLTNQVARSCYLIQISCSQYFI